MTEDVFSFLDEVSIKAEDIEDMTLEWWIPDFIVKNAISMIYSTRGQGKTYFTYAISKELLKNPVVKRVIYLDGDNGRRQLKERNVGNELMSDKRFNYILHEGLNMPMYKYLGAIASKAYGDIYKDCIFLVDSARDWCIDIDNHKHARTFMEHLKKIRKHGGTVFIIHHLTKTGRNVSGSGELENSLDSSHKLKQKAKGVNMIHYVLTAQKQRDPVKDVAYSVNTVTLDLEDLDKVYADMTPEDEAFIEKAQKAIKASHDGLNQSQLLKALGYDRTSKAGAARIKKYTGSHWNVKKKGSRDVFIPL